MNEFKSDSKVTLNNGSEIPVLGLGTWKLDDGKQVEEAIELALKAEYRMIDTAMIYENERGVGRAIKNAAIPREEIFVTTKLWNTDQGYKSTFKALDASLERLGLDYVDLYLVHWPGAYDMWEDAPVQNRRTETWKAMEEILASGKAKAIGVSNYTIKHLEEMKGYAKITPAVNQIEFHPFLYQEKLLTYCKENGIAVEAYSPLARGEKLADPRISAIAQKYKKSNAQILIRWSLQHGCIVIPKSSNEGRLKENMDVFDFEISNDDMQALNNLNENIYLTWDPNPIE